MTTTFTPRPAGLHPSRARNAAAFSLLQTLPAGTEVVFDQYPRTSSVTQNTRRQRGLSASVNEFRKRFQNRNGLGKVTTRTVAEGDTITAYVRADKPAAPVGTQPVVSYVQTSGSGSTNSAAGSATTTQVTVTPVANPKRTTAQKTGKRRYVRRAETFARHLETGDLLARGYFLPVYKTTKIVTAWPFKNNATADKETLQRRAYSHAQQLNKLAADRPFKFVVKTTASAVRINVVLTD